jgi:HD-like signal output (HDOD) protein
LGCATIAKLLAEYIPNLSADDAFLIGVLHDIGKLLLLDVAPKQYGELLNSSQGASVVAQEEFWFGMDHAEIGLQSAVSWKLPKEIQVGIGYHHCPHSASSHTELAALTHIANQLAKNWNIGSDGFVIAKEVGTGSRITIDDNILSKVRDRANQAFRDTVEEMR